MSSYESEHKFLFHHISNESVLDFNSISRETNENVRIGHEQEFNPLQKNDIRCRKKAEKCFRA